MEHQPLTPEAKAIIRELHNYFDATGERQLFGDHDYLIERVDGDCLRFIPYANLGEVITIDENQIKSDASITRYNHLMLTFSAACNKLQEKVKFDNSELEIS